MLPKKISKLFLSAAFILYLTPSFGVELTPLKPSTTQEITAIEILEKLKIYHFNRISVDDALSEQLFDAYLDSLDPNRSYFVQQDIAEFSKYRLTFDDMLKRGDLSAAFDIFNRYQQRFVSREEKKIALLDQPENFDFSRDELLQIDRSEAEWMDNEQSLEDLWRRNVKYQLLSLKLAGKSLEKASQQLQKRFKNNLERSIQISAEDVFQLFMNSLTSLYDPHTSYFSPRTSENFNISMSLSLEGIGAVLNREDEFTKVSSIVKGGPADKQGELQTSDRIVSVAQGQEGEFVDVVGWRLDEVVDLIRGPKDSVVKLEVIPSGQDETQRKTIAITRNKVKLEDQSSKKKVIELVDNGGVSRKYGVVQIPAFYIDFEALRNGDPEYKSTTRDVQNLINQLLTEDQVEGIIIDLRGNGGGSLQEANALTGLFIEAGPTVQIRRSSNRVIRQGKPVPSAYYDGPLVVIIDRLSASASEIFAGAIQDYKRGIIVGEQSFGKGTVQSLAELESGQIKMTESKFYRISGESTQHRGVVPDIHFPDNYNHDDVGESALEKALPWDTINPVRHPVYGVDMAMIKAADIKHNARIVGHPDFDFVKQRYAIMQERAQREFIPLKEDKLKAQRENDRKALRDIENVRRAAKGEELLPEDEPEQDDESSDAVAATESTQENSDDQNDTEQPEKADFVVEEAAHILQDAFLKISSQLAVKE